MVEEINGEGVFRMGQWSCSEHPLLEEGGFQEFLKKPGINAIVRPSILDEQYDSDDDGKKKNSGTTSRAISFIKAASKRIHAQLRVFYNLFRVHYCSQRETCLKFE